ncbi:MAG: hypothetical protein QOF99_5361, partial [Pseudonocardiales bacterium]|nr:hypothetical protein [Pseudonocardiales bacterium]
MAEGGAPAGAQGWAMAADNAADKAVDEAPSPWAPLRSAVFRALWIAVLLSNIGTWM